MKKHLLTLAIAVVSAIAYGQGTIGFPNSALTAVKINDGVTTVNVAANAAIVYGVFVAGSLDPVLPLGIASATAGVIGAAGIYQLPGTVGGQVVALQVRGWSSSFGNDWQAAMMSPGAIFGQTDVRNVTLGPTPGPGAVIWQGATGTVASRFRPLLLTVVVPEPSTIALGLLGGLMLFFRRK